LSLIFLCNQKVLLPKKLV